MDVRHRLDDQGSQAGKEVTATEVRPGDPVRVPYMEQDGRSVAQNIAVTRQQGKSERRHQDGGQRPPSGARSSAIARIQALRSVSSTDSDSPGRTLRVRSQIVTA